MKLIHDAVVTELTALAKSEGVVFWMPDQWLDDEAFERLFPDLKVINADKGFLNLNVALSTRDNKPTLVVSKKAPEGASLLQTSLMARFATFSTSNESQLRKQLGWPPSLEPWLAEHGAIFDEPLVAGQIKKLKASDLDPASMSEKVVYYAIGAEARINFPVSMALLSVGVSNAEVLLGSLANAKLEEKFWQMVSRELGYLAQNPSLLDFDVWLANSLAALVALPPEQMATATSVQANLAFFFDDFRIRNEGAYVKFCEEHQDSISSLLNFSIWSNYQQRKISLR